MGNSHPSIEVKINLESQILLLLNNEMSFTKLRRYDAFETYVDCYYSKLPKEELRKNGERVKYYVNEYGNLDGLYYEYYPNNNNNNNIKLEIKYENGNIVYYKSYYPNGRCHIENMRMASWQYSKYDGKYTEYDETGQYIVICSYLHNLDDDYVMCDLYNEDGIMVYEKTFINGKLNGLYKEYYDNGNIKIKTQYNNGMEIIGTRISYNDNGSDKSKYEWLESDKGCKFLRQTYHNNGVLATEGYYTVDKDDPIYYKQWEENGKLTCYALFENGKLISEEHY